jgi:hypothetical protein
MDDTSIFTDKSIMPAESDLSEILGKFHKLWIGICEFTLKKYPKGVLVWNFEGAKYGWNFRIKDKKRTIIYLLPRSGYFKVAFVFGEKAYNEIMNSKISNEVKTELSQTNKYAEGRGIRIEIKNENQLSDIEKLIDIKLRF